jgi:phosphinothricin acetyltransferase
MPLFRAGATDDLPALTELYNHYIANSHFTFDVASHSVEARAGWFSRFHSSGPHQLVVATEGERLLGYACSGPLREKAAYATSVEVSVYLSPAQTGRGLGRALYQRLFDRLAVEDVHRAYAGVALPNPASERLHLALGFAPIGTYDEVGRKFGRYWSVRWYEKALIRRAEG